MSSPLSGITVTRLTFLHWLMLAGTVLGLPACTVLSAAGTVVSTAASVAGTAASTTASVAGKAASTAASAVGSAVKSGTKNETGAGPGASGATEGAKP